ncbi:hypothetical protein N665_0151s0031 [Sinapis alba]|nr:hypothetical protein N665_0151s0031 [Sinapis alba]
MSNPIMAASSSMAGGITGGQRRESIIEVNKKSKPNPYCWYYRCLYAASLKLENDDHVFKWVDEAFNDEIQQLDYQVRMLEKEVQLLKATIRSQGPKIMPKMIMISGGCVIISVVLVLVVLMYKIHTYGIVYVPPDDVRDFMDTLEFHVMQIVQRINDVELSIPSSS